jgi:hypothetical protein
MIWIAESKHSLFSWLLFQGHAVWEQLLTLSYGGTRGI